MIQLSKGGILHGFFENSITEFLERNDVYHFFGYLPRTDCQLLWGLFRNSILYALVYWTVFIVPLLFITVLSIPFTDIWLLHIQQIGYNIVGFFHYDEVGFIVGVLIMVLPFSVTTSLLGYLFVMLIIKIFGFGSIFIRSASKSKDISILSLIKIRWDGIKNRYCTPVEWVEKS